MEDKLVCEAIKLKDKAEKEIGEILIQLENDTVLDCISITYNRVRNDPHGNRSTKAEVEIVLQL